MPETADAARDEVSGRSIESLLAGAVRRHPDRPALTLGDRGLTYAALDGIVDRLAQRLAELAGPLEGRRVPVIAPNVPALVAGIFAAWRNGAVAVPLSARLREYELTAILRDAEPTAVVTVSSYRGYDLADLLGRVGRGLPTLRGTLVVDDQGEGATELSGGEERREAEPLDASVEALLYTSGTTGAAKGALIPFGREAGAAAVLSDVLELTPEDVCAQVAPIAHAFGLSCLLTAFASGAGVLLADSSFNLRSLLAAVGTHSATVLHGSPALFVSLLKASPTGLPSVRRGFSGGAAPPVGLVEELERIGIQILNLYGMTEIAAAACCRPSDPPAVRYGTAGQPLPGFEWRTDPSESDVAGGGELLVRGPWVSPGYLGRPEETAEAFTDDWFRTGDLGRFDRDGNLVISGRRKDVIHVAGYSVFPAELEGFLLTHPGVAHAAVVGLPHEGMGEILHAFLVPAEGAELTRTSVLQFARGGIADYKLPYAITILDELPLLASGKPDRIALRARAAEEAKAGLTP